MLGYDMLQLGALLYLTGGLENPFAFLLIAPVTVSASTLPPRVDGGTWRSCHAVATLLTEFHLPLPWFHHSRFLLPLPYVMGMWAAVVSGILFIGLYSWRTAEEARRMAEALAAAELVLAREQKLSALDGARRRRGTRARHPLGDHRRRGQGAAARRQAQRPALRGSSCCCARKPSAAAPFSASLPACGEQQDIIVSRLPVSHLIEEIGVRRTGWSRRRSRWRPGRCPA